MTDDDEIRTTLRLPTTLRDRVAAKGREAGRSLNSQIVYVLERSLSNDGTSPEVMFDLQELANENEELKRQLGMKEPQTVSADEYPPLTSEAFDKMFGQRLNEAITEEMRIYKRKLDRLENAVAENLGIALDLDAEELDDDR